MRGDFQEPLNLGSSQMVTINELAEMAISFENKNLKLKHIPGPLGVRGRNSDNSLIKKELGWEPGISLNEGLKKTYFWIQSEVEAAKKRGESVEATSQKPTVS